MKINVRFAGSMKELAKISDMEVELPDQANLDEMLIELKKMLPEAFIVHVIDPVLKNMTKVPALLTLNRRTLSYQQALLQPLKDGDSIVFVPPMEGG